MNESASIQVSLLAWFRWPNPILSNHRTFLEHLHGLPLDGREDTAMKKGVPKGLTAQMERLMHNQEIPLHSGGAEAGGTWRTPTAQQGHWALFHNTELKSLGVA